MDRLPGHVVVVTLVRTDIPADPAGDHQSRFVEVAITQEKLSAMSAEEFLKLYVAPAVAHLNLGTP
jgi:hypothetical protein